MVVIFKRRSDKHRNRVFNDNFHLIVMDPPSGSSASNSADRLPSPAVPDRPGKLRLSKLYCRLNLDITDRRRRIGPRKSTESGTNISLSPFNIAPSTSTESASGDKEVRILKLEFKLHTFSPILFLCH